MRFSSRTFTLTVHRLMKVLTKVLHELFWNYNKLTSSLMAIGGLILHYPTTNEANKNSVKLAFGKCSLQL